MNKQINETKEKEKIIFYRTRIIQHKTNKGQNKVERRVVTNL